jgi:hypothetical protein
MGFNGVTKFNRAGNRLTANASATAAATAAHAAAATSPATCNNKATRVSVRFSVGFIRLLKFNRVERLIHVRPAAAAVPVLTRWGVVVLAFLSVISIPWRRFLTLLGGGEVSDSGIAA